MISESCSSALSDMVADSSFEVPEHNIGTRIESNGNIGTIKYIGPIEGHPGYWLGIEWDDVSRGKHDGSVKGVEYFKTLHPKSGTFVRKERVNFGQTLIEAIINRYRFNESESELELNRRQLSSIRRTINAPFIDLVGFDKVASKQSNIENLEIVSVRLQNVSSIGDPIELKALCPNIKELDLSKNLLTNWSDIFNICMQLDNLVWLNVSENRLTFPDNIDNYEYTFPKIQVLICGHMQLTWDNILMLANIFTDLKELRASNNLIQCMCCSADNHLQNLEVLDLEGNCIQQWREILKLANLNLLKYLILDNISLESIWFNSPGPVDYFMNLKRLAISENRINDWKSVSELNKLPSLEDLKFTRNPILLTEDVEMRDQIIIAKIANLKVLNGRRFRDDERRAAEYDYLRKFGLEWLKVKNKPEEQEFLETHNRFRELMEKYGEPEESEYSVPANIIQSTLITVNLVHESETITKKIPPSMLVQKLILMVQKLFKLSERPTLTYVSSNNSDIEIELDDEMKEVGFYSIQENDVILVKT